MTPKTIQNNDITIFRDNTEGMLYYILNGKIYPINIIQGDLFKVHGNFDRVNNLTDYKIVDIPTKDGIRTFQLIQPSTQVIKMGGGGGGNKSGTATIGPSGIGTPNRVVKFLTATTIGDSLGYDNGTSVGYGTTAPSASALIDITSTSQGFLMPRMTVAQRNAIVVPAVGLEIYNKDNNTINYWDGVIWRTLDTNIGDYMNGGNSYGANASIGLIDNFDWTFLTNNTTRITILRTGQVGIGVSPSSLFHVGGAARFGISASTTASLILQNSTNANTITINSGVTSASYSLVLPTAQGGANTFLENDGAGNLSWGTVVLTNFYQNGGNAFGGNATIGLTDNFNWSFLTNNVVRGLIDNTGLWAIGSASTTAGSRLAVTSTGTTNATFIEKLFNSTPTLIFAVRDDGYISAGIANGSMTIGLTSGFNNALVNNTFIGVGVATPITTGTSNVGVGSSALNALTSGTQNVAVGFSALTSNNTGSQNTAVGNNALANNTSGIQNVGIGLNALFNNNGMQNVAVGYFSLFHNTTGIDNTAIGTSALSSNTTGSQNTSVGSQALTSNTTSGDNTAMGFSALLNSTGSNNNAFGKSSLGLNSTGTDNCAFGRHALILNVSGNNNTGIGNLALSAVLGSGNVGIGFMAGAYETGSNFFYVNNQDRVNITNDKNKSLLYGKFDAVPTNQYIVINGVLYMQDTAAPNHYWSIVNTGGAFVFADTGSANAPT